MAFLLTLAHQRDSRPGELRLDRGEDRLQQSVGCEQHQSTPLRNEQGLKHEIGQKAGETLLLRRRRFPGNPQEHPVFVVEGRGEHCLGCRPVAGRREPEPVLPVIELPVDGEGCRAEHDGPVRLVHRLLHHRGNIQRCDHETNVRLSAEALSALQPVDLLRVFPVAQEPPADLSHRAQPPQLEPALEDEGALPLLLRTAGQDAVEVKLQGGDGGGQIRHRLQQKSGESGIGTEGFQPEGALRIEQLQGCGIQDSRLVREGRELLPQPRTGFPQRSAEALLQGRQQPCCPALPLPEQPARVLHDLAAREGLGEIGGCILLHVVGFVEDDALKRGQDRG